MTSVHISSATQKVLEGESDSVVVVVMKVVWGPAVLLRGSRTSGGDSTEPGMETWAAAEFRRVSCFVADILFLRIAEEDFRISLSSVVGWGARGSCRVSIHSRAQNPGLTFTQSIWNRTQIFRHFV